MTQQHPSYKILKALWLGPLVASDIAKNVGITTKVAVVYLNDLAQKSYIAGDGNLMGFYAITTAGRNAALAADVISFELFAECVGQPHATAETVSLDLGDGQAHFANKAVLDCGCIAYQPQPPDLTPRIRVKPCGEDHANLLRSLWGFEF